jgi:hypothetical protein
MFNGDFADREPAFARDDLRLQRGRQRRRRRRRARRRPTSTAASTPRTATRGRPARSSPTPTTSITGRPPRPRPRPSSATTTTTPSRSSSSLLAGPGFKGFVIAAVMGAVVSSLASMLNAASTIFTMDIFKRFLKPDATDHQQVLMGRDLRACRGGPGLPHRPDLRQPRLRRRVQRDPEPADLPEPGHPDDLPVRPLRPPGARGSRASSASSSARFSPSHTPRSPTPATSPMIR